MKQNCITGINNTVFVPWPWFWNARTFMLKSFLQMKPAPVSIPENEWTLYSAGEVILYLIILYLII
jgi:hypothetical protein